MSYFASPKHEMGMHAEIALPAGADNIFKAKKSVVNKKRIKYISGSLIVRND